MAVNKPESSRTPRVRRRTKKDDLEPVEKASSDDALDVIFEENDEAEAPKPRRKKAAAATTRRRRATADEAAAPVDAEVSFPEEPEAPPARPSRRREPVAEASDERPSRRREPPAEASDERPSRRREPAAEAPDERRREPAPSFTPAPSFNDDYESEGASEPQPSADAEGAPRGRGPRGRNPRGRGRNSLRDRNYNPEERVERFDQDDVGSHANDDVLSEARDFQVAGGDDFGPDAGGEFFDGEGPDGEGPDGGGEGPDGGEGEFGPRRRRRRRRRRRGGEGDFGGGYAGGQGYQGGGGGQAGYQGGQGYQGGGGPGYQGGGGQGYQGGGGPGYQGGGGQGYQGGGNFRGRRGDRRGPMPGGGRNQMSGPPQNRRQRPQQRVRSVAPSTEVIEGVIDGVLELHPKGYGFLRDPKKNYLAQESDPFVPSSFIEKNFLREGVLLRAEVGSGVRNQGPRVREILQIESRSPEDYAKIKSFDELTAITPFRQIKLETTSRPLTMRVMDLVTPVGKGQRALLVAPPRTGKTMLLQDIADSVSHNHPEMHLMVLLIDERPEEVTEMRRKVKGEVIASSMDREVESHVRMSQLIIERGKRLAETGQDVFILMDSITRMARAFNKWSGGGGAHESRTMSGGLHVKALDIPKKLFGTARQFDEGGSLTIVATALIDTGSKMDEVIFQEFKGTGNMELVLSRDLADRRIWPAIDITRSGTRHEEKLFAPEILESVTMLRRSLISLSPIEAMEHLTRTLEKFPTNKEFLARVKSLL